MSTRASRPPSRWSRFTERLSAWMARSSHVFLAGLIVACAIEVAVDWNSTLYEINVLRAALQQKGEHYADLLRKAAEGPLLAYDWDELERLSAGVFDDDEVVYVRFTDVLGNTLYDRLRSEFAPAFLRAHKQSFRVHYRRVMDRDAAGLVTDPVGLRQRMARSRHRDFIQAFTDEENRLIARLAAPPAVREPPPRVLYQDRLADERGRLDRDVSYALGAVTADDGEAYGVVLVAFRNDALNRAVRNKLLKGLAITVFFVGLILVQNFLSRRAKLRLLDLEAALAAARAAVRAALPATPSLPWGRVGVAFAQADRVGGTVYDLVTGADGALDLLVAVPEGTGVDAAFASVVLRDVYRRLPAESRADPSACLVALAGAYDRAPLGRPIELVLMRVEADGRVRGVAAGLEGPSLCAAGVATPAPLGDPLALTSARVTAPARPFSLSLDGRALALYDDGLPRGETRALPSADALAQLAAGTAEPQAATDAVVARAVRRYKKKHSDDLLALLIVPSSRPADQRAE